QMIISDVWRDPVSNTLVTLGEEGEEALSNSEMTTYVNLHTANFSYDLKAGGKHVIRTNRALNYWYVKDGKFTTSQLFSTKVNRGDTYDPFLK
ncbi:MAG: hypothetical protein LIO65_09880, partial [Odoribacter sp.]|nr:hypothetical protein [Odoribacter sp.]